eukprot:g12380.t1
MQHGEGPDPCEIFLGGLPHEVELLADLELSLRTSLEALAAADLGERAAPVRLRLHTSRGEGRGLGYGFAWLPCGAEGVAQGLAAAGRLSYELRGETQVALVRPARGHQRGRAAPNSQPVFTCLEVTALTDVPQELVCAAAMRWQSFLEPWGVGLAFRHHPLEQMVIKPGEGIVVLGFSNGLSLLPSLLSRAKESGAPVLVLVEEGAPVSAVVSGVDVLCWKDVGEDRGAGLVFSAVRRCVHWQLSRRLKVFVCDCDQTLWGGVVAEDGVEELDLEGPFRVLQEKVVRLQELGRLICLASRNQEDGGAISRGRPRGLSTRSALSELPPGGRAVRWRAASDVLKVFEQREMPLKREHLAAWQVHWGSKVLSLRRLASELRLGLEAFVFLDDNPAEVEAVRRALPQVICVSIPADADAFHRLLQTHWALDLWTNTGTAEDAQRTQMYREQALRKQARQAAPSFEAFLQSLQVRIDLRRPNHAELARVVQLSQRTNQMNSTQLRFAHEGVLKEWMTDGRFVLAGWVSDRFGDYGLVACAFCAQAPQQNALVIECLCMSCRVLHRGVEEALLCRVATEAVASGQAGKAKAKARQRTKAQRPVAPVAGGRDTVWVLIPFLPSPRNDLMRNFLGRVAAYAKVPPPHEGPGHVPLGRHGGRRGQLAPAMALSAEMLQGLKGGHTAEASDDLTEVRGRGRVGARGSIRCGQDVVQKTFPSGKGQEEESCIKLFFKFYVGLRG